MAPKQVKVNEFFQSSVRPSLGRNFHLFQRIFSFDFFLFLRVPHVRYDIVLPLAIYSTSAFVLSVQRNVNRVQKPSDGRRTGGGREEDGRRTLREGQVCKIWQLSINQVWKTMKRTGENKRPLFALGSLQMNVICRSPLII